jgi:hypothetical protein
MHPGVLKTHRLLLQAQASLLAPTSPDESCQSVLSIGPRALRDVVEHFPVSKTAKSDPQLVWNFGEAEVEVKSIESSLDSKGPLLSSGCFVLKHSAGRNQLSTELTITAEEFDKYDLYAVPTTIAFHLREFNVCQVTILLLTLTNILAGNYRIRRIYELVCRLAFYGNRCTTLHHCGGRHLSWPFRHFDEPSSWD